MSRLLIDAAYAVVSTAAMAALMMNAVSQRSFGEFERKCVVDLSHHNPTAVDGGGLVEDGVVLAYRDTFTVKHYSPALWCGVSWTLGTFLSSKWYMLGLGNALVAIVSLVRKALVYFIFGRLVATEAQHSYDRILNFVLFKVISVRTTLDADWEDLAIWTIAYCCFGALYLIGGLARDHMEGLRLAPAQSGARWGFIGLLISLFVGAAGMGGLCWILLRPLFSILCIESLIILFDVGQTLVKYAAYAWNGDSTESWESRSDAVLMCEFVTDLCILILTLIHYIHILAINGVALNIVSALVFFNIRNVVSKLYRKTRKLLAFRKAVRSMKSRFPDASKEDIIRFNDRCSICREMLLTAKKLPCDHLFHRSCLRSWLVRHLSCPTCRITLSSADVGRWANNTTGSPVDASEHGSDLVFASPNSG